MTGSVSQNLIVLVPRLEQGLRMELLNYPNTLVDVPVNFHMGASPVRSAKATAFLSMSKILHH